MDLLQELRSRALGSEFNLEPRLDDAFLLRFLRVRKYNVDKAFESLKKYYARVYKHFDLMHVRPSDIRNAMYSRSFRVFKNRTKEGRRVIVAAISDWNPKEITFREVQGKGLFIVEHISHEVETQDNGVVVIVDCGGLCFNHVKNISPIELIEAIGMLQDGIPIIMSEIHLVNAGYLVWPLFQIAIKFLKEKIRRRVKIHSNVSGLREFISPAILPEALSGDLTESDAYDTEMEERILNEDLDYEGFWNPKRQSEGGQEGLLSSDSGLATVEALG